jgi:hypothetical protein
LRRISFAHYFFQQYHVLECSHKCTKRRNFAHYFFSL